MAWALGLDNFKLYFNPGHSMINNNYLIIDTMYYTLFYVIDNEYYNYCIMLYALSFVLSDYVKYFWNLNTYVGTFPWSTASATHQIKVNCSSQIRHVWGFPGDKPLTGG